MRKIFLYNFGLYLCLLSSIDVFALETKVIDLSRGLKEAESYSKKIQSIEQNYLSAVERGRSLRSENFPQFAIDGQYKMVSHVSSLSLPQTGGRNIEMGDKKNYSAGIGVNYLLNDFGQVRKNLESVEMEAEAEKENKNLSIEQLKLSLKNIFYKLLFQTSQLNSLFDSWVLSKDQEKDMEKRFRSGTSSRLDYTNSRKDTLAFKLKFLQMQSEFSSTLQDWLTLTGEQIDEEKLRGPLPQELAQRLPDQASVSINLSYTDNHIGKGSISLDANHPALLQLEHLKMVQRLRAESVEKSYWPRLGLGARTSLEYPDFGKKESYNQNSVFITLTMPLWDAGKRSGQMASFYAMERSFDAQKENLKREFEGTARKMNQFLFQIQEQIDVAREGTRDAQILAKLTYQSYINGKTNYLHVQSANLKVLEWKTQVDSLVYARSLALAQLEFLGEKK